MNIQIDKVKVNPRKRPLKDISSLKKSIQELGLLNPITVTQDLTLIAGMHRLTACKELGFDTIECQVVELDALRAELAEIDENIVRNQLTEFEEALQLARRKEIYEALNPKAKHGAIGRGRKKSSHNENSFSQDTASKTGRGKSTVSRKVQIGATLEAIADDVRGTQIEDSQKDLLALAQIADKEGVETAKEVLSIVTGATNGSENGTKLVVSKQTVKTALREYRRRQQAEQAQSIEIENNLIDFRHGDFIDALSDIPDGSIDLILTDPPYPHEYIDEYSKLSAFAARVLKPGGFCISYAGHIHLPEVMQRLGENLDYYWTFVLLHSSFSTFVTPRNLYAVWKPVLIYQNGFSLYKPEKDPLADVIDGSGKAKFSHLWQQGEDELDALIDHFTNVGAIICDPFAGSGTTLIKAAKMKRYAIGSEIEQSHYNNAKKRIANAL